MLRTRHTLLRKHMVAMMLASLMGLILSTSVSTAREKALVDIDIEEFNSNTFFIPYGEEKTISTENVVGVSVNPVDIALLLDVSISMGNCPSSTTTNCELSRLDLEKRAATRIISATPSESKIAIVQFGEDNIPVVSFTSEKPLLQNTINNMQATGYSSKLGEKSDEAITMASRDENLCVIFLITDGIEAGKGLYVFSDFIGRAKTEKVPVFFILINPDIDHEEFERDVIETHGTLIVIEDESDLLKLSKQVENVISDYAIEELTIQILPFPDTKTILTITDGNSLSPLISGDTVRIRSFPPHTILNLDIESAINLEKHTQPVEITPYSVVVTYTDPVSEEKITLPEERSTSIRVSFETFYEHNLSLIMGSIIGSFGIIGITAAWGYSRHQKRVLARELVKRAEANEASFRFEEAIEKLEDVVNLYTQLKDPVAEKYKDHLGDLRKKLSEMESQKSAIIKVLTETQKNVDNAVQTLRTEKYLDEFFPSFSQLRTVSDVQEPGSKLPKTMKSTVVSSNDPETIKKYFYGLEKFSKESKHQFLDFTRARNMYENENSRELIALLLEIYPQLGVDEIEEIFFEDKEVARFLLNLWRLHHPEEEGVFNEYVSSRKKEGYENFIAVKTMHRDISRKMNTMRMEPSSETLEKLDNTIVDIDRTIALSCETLQEFSSRYEETGDPEYGSVVRTCEEIQEDLKARKDEVEALKKDIEKEIEERSVSLLETLSDLKRRIGLGDYEEEVINSLYKLESAFCSIKSVDKIGECRNLVHDLEKKIAIVELLEYARVMTLHKVCENVGVSLDEMGNAIVRELCRQIIAEKNRKYDFQRYQLFTEYGSDIFLDFNMLARNALEKGKAPSEIETIFGERILLPKEVQNDLINILRRKGGLHG